MPTLSDLPLILFVAACGTGAALIVAAVKIGLVS